MIDENIFKKVSIFVALGILAALAFYIIWPLASSIVAGLILAYIFYPVHKRVLNVIREKNTSALILILLVLFLIFIPAWFILPFLIRQSFDIYLFLQKIDFTTIISSAFPSLTDLSAAVSLSLNKLITTITSSVVSSGSGIIFNLPQLALKIVVVFFVFFFGLRDGQLFLNYAQSLSPFSKSAEEEFSKKFKDITNSVVYGFFIVGIIQGLMTGAGLFVFGVPKALLFTLFAIIAAIIPFVGAWLIWIPASIYLIVTGHVWQGVCLFLYGALVISWIDNILRGYIVSKKARISSAVVVVGMIGGLLVFGFLGLLIGPLILAYLLLILDAYRNKKFPNLFS